MALGSLVPHRVLYKGRACYQGEALCCAFFRENPWVYLHFALWLRSLSSVLRGGECLSSWTTTHVQLCG